MASSSCQKCLLRPSFPYATSTPPIKSLRIPGSSNSFSTSAAQAATAKSSTTAKSSNKTTNRKPQSQFQKGGQALGLKKKTIVKTGRPPAIGERKAARKRIVLSNTNALEVPGMVEVTPEALLDPGNVGKVLALPGTVVDSLRVVEAFKTSQTWGMFRRPGTLIREDTTKLAQILQKAEEEKSSEVFIIEGGRATGKSLLLLQAMAAAFMKGWVVLNIPEAQDLTTAITDYGPIKDTNPTQYSQNAYTAKWLSQIAAGNGAILSELLITKQHILPINIPADISLLRLAELGARDPEVSWPFFRAFWEELTLPGRPPILMTLDGLSHACKLSSYRNAAFEPIHALDLAILNHFFTYLGKHKSLPNGGAVLAATSKGNNPRNEALELAIKQQLEKQAVGEVITKADPFKPVEQREYEAVKGIEVLRLGGLSKGEARGLMEYWAASGLLRQRVDEKTVVEKWALAGNGVVGEIERGTLRMRV